MKKKHIEVAILEEKYKASEQICQWYIHTGHDLHIKVAFLLVSTFSTCVIFIHHARPKAC